MTQQSLPTEDRLIDLLAMRATEGISAETERELGAWSDCDLLDEAAAVLAIGLAQAEGLEPLPGRVVSELERAIDLGWEDTPDSSAAAVVEQPSGPEPLARIEPKPRNAVGSVSRQPVSPEVGRLSLLGIGGWLAAAACLALLVVVQAPERTLTAEERLGQMAARPGIVRTSWAGLDDAGLSETPHAYDQDLSGEVLWDPETNEGFLVFEGLGKNKPSEYQYQLWIFDANRPSGQLPQHGDGILSQRPVDGGVFDADAGRLVIPIDAKLPVGDAAIFAITVEPPGGVVVSDRDIVTLALVQ
ncbi:MAG: anti-sigma factor [Planctomycetota bacterium]